MKAYKQSSGIRSAYVIIDIFFIALSFYIPYLIRYSNLPILQFLSLPEKWAKLSYWALKPYTMIFLFWGILSVLFLNNYNLYRTMRDISFLDETVLVFKALLFACLPAAAAVFFFQVKIFSRSVFLANAALLFLTLAGWRIVKRFYVERAVSKGHNRQKVLIIGAGRMGRKLVREINENPYLGLEIVGYLDDNITGEIDSCPVLGTLANFESVARQKFVDEVLVSIPSARQKVARLIQACQRLRLGIRIVPDLLDLTTETVEATAIGSIPLLEYHGHLIHGTELILKRIFDLVASGLALVILLPLLPVIALLIKIESPGPVFYVSDRCGKDGRCFKFFKFRTMVEGAEKMLEKLRHRNETDGPVFKMRNDPRVTRVGRWLRRFSLDELPQIWNVFRGDMSLVGPRPPTPAEVEQYADWQLKRLDIRPGITCLWQIMGRSDLSFREWMKWDLFYIEKWSFWLDIKILLLTLVAVVRGRGAY